jgi:branched-chain amino acid aminotransferase
MSPAAVSVTPPKGFQQAHELAATKKLTNTVNVTPLSNGHSYPQPLDAAKLKFTRTSTPRPVLEEGDPRINLASECTDHMITAVWHAAAGWDAPELKPYGPLSIMPLASVLHYATECFEGLKVYRGYDGKLRLFRPDCNARRLLISAKRICLPGFDPEELEKLIFALVSVDGTKFLPKSRPGSFLYLRPAIIGTSAELGIKTPSEATLFIIATYMNEVCQMPGGMRLLASQGDIRAWPGGYGFAKVGANYGPSLMANQEARSRGYHQVLWLFGEDRMVTEAGASNFFVVWRSRGGRLQLVTAPLDDGIILDGITRRSILELVRERLSDGELLEALEIVEEKYTMTDIVEAIEDGRMVEAFACGTAVSLFHYEYSKIKTSPN